MSYSRFDFRFAYFFSTVLFYFVSSSNIPAIAQINRYSETRPLNFNLSAPSVGDILLFEKILHQKEEEEKKARVKEIYRGRLQVYGGKGHETYLGCLSCPSIDPLSIWNSNGEYGIGYFMHTESIWNERSRFGDNYSDYSPWNNYANYPPVIVDFDGNFYGYFTANKSKDKRCSIEFFNFISENYKLVIDNYPEIGLKIK